MIYSIIFLICLILLLVVDRKGTIVMVASVIAFLQAIGEYLFSEFTEPQKYSQDYLRAVQIILIILAGFLIFRMIKMRENNRAIVAGAVCLVLLVLSYIIHWYMVVTNAAII
jgi:hypothetical protein